MSPTFDVVYRQLYNNHAAGQGDTIPVAFVERYDRTSPISKLLWSRSNESATLSEPGKIFFLCFCRTSGRKVPFRADEFCRHDERTCEFVPETGGVVYVAAHVALVVVQGHDQGSVPLKGGDRERTERCARLASSR